MAAITEAFGRFRVLCALRDGPRGVTALNAALTRRFRAALDLPGLAEGPGASPWFAGRPVLVSNNDYVLRLFNGDIGIALPDADGELLVHFPDAAAPGGFRAIAPVRLPRHETAFAMTVHKSQGSEFDGVLVMLPEQRSRVLTRELLYTADHAREAARGAGGRCGGAGAGHRHRHHAPFRPAGAAGRTGGRAAMIPSHAGCRSTPAR